MSRTLDKSQVHCSGVIQWWELAIRSCPLICLQSRLRNLGEDCSAVGLYCVSITWQQIFKHFLNFTAVDVLPQGCQLRFSEARFWNSGLLTYLFFFKSKKSRQNLAFCSWENLTLKKDWQSCIFNITNLFWRVSMTMKGANVSLPCTVEFGSNFLYETY